MIRIRSYEDSDWVGVWRILEPVFRAGETYAVAPDIAEDDARRMWISLPTATYVAANEHGEVVGTYYLKPNQSGPGAHVCNCGYVVDERARGQGVAGAMCEHSQREAVSQGFRAMQYNLVVATNVGAIRLWKQRGFTVAGVLPGAFQHPRLGFVDAMVMYRELVS